MDNSEEENASSKKCNVYFRSLSKNPSYAPYACFYHFKI